MIQTEFVGEGKKPRKKAKLKPETESSIPEVSTPEINGTQLSETEGSYLPVEAELSQAKTHFYQPDAPKLYNQAIKGLELYMKITAEEFERLAKAPSVKYHEELKDLLRQAELVDIFSSYLKWRKEKKIVSKFPAVTSNGQLIIPLDLEEIAEQHNVPVSVEKHYVSLIAAHIGMDITFLNNRIGQNRNGTRQIYL